MINTNQPHDTQWAARIQVFSGALIISFSSIFVKVAQVGPTTAGFYRMLFGSLVLVAAAYLRRQPLWLSWQTTLAAACAGLSFFMGLVFWHHSIHFIGPGLSTIFANHQVFVVALAAILFMGEKPGRRMLFAIPLAVSGLFMIVAPDWALLGSEYKYGILLGLAAAVCYGIFLIIMRWSASLNASLSPIASIALASSFSALFMAIEVLRVKEGFNVPDMNSWTALLALGLICHALGWWLIIQGMPKIPLATVGLSILLQPTGAFIWDIIFFSRSTSMLEAVGVVLALGAIYLGSTARRARVGH